MMWGAGERGGVAKLGARRIVFGVLEGLSGQVVSREWGMLSWRDQPSSPRVFM